MADPLHFGYFGGIATKLLWFLFGLALSALAITGAALYSIRVGRALKQPSRALWEGMGVWKWPSLLLVALCLGLTVSFLGQ